MKLLHVAAEVARYLEDRGVPYFIRGTSPTALGRASIHP